MGDYVPGTATDWLQRSSLRFPKRRLLPILGSLALLWALVIALAPGARAAATVALGTQTVGSNLDSNPAGLAEAFEATATATGTVGSLSVYVDPSSTATTLVAGLYSDDAGQPGTLLSQGSISPPAPGTWNTVVLPATSVTSGTAYWIGVLSPSGSGTFAFRDTSGGAVSENSSQSSLAALPSTWSAGPKWNDSPISAYATLTTTGPVLSASPTSISSGAIVGGSDPVSSTVSVTNTGSGSLTFSATSDSPWLTVSPASGTAPQNLTVSETVTGLSAGTYTGHVTVTASGVQGSPEVLTVTLVVNAPAPSNGLDWPAVEHDPARTGTAPAEAQIGTANAASLARNWATGLDGKVSAQPLFLSDVQVMGAAHDVVIAATNKNTMYALDANSGAVLWSNHLVNAPASCGIPGGFGITAAPVVDRSTGRIFAVTDDGALRTLSLATGAEVAAALPLLSNVATNYVWGGLNLVNGDLYIPTGSNGCDQAPWQGGIFQVDVTGSAPQLVKHWITVPSLPASEAGGGIWGWGGVSADPTTGHIYAATSDDATNLTGDEGYTPYSGGIIGLDSGLNLLGWYQPPQNPNYNCGSAPPCDQDFAATPLAFQPPGCPTMLAAGNKNGDLYVTPEARLEANTGTDGSNVQVISLNQDIDDLGLGGLSGTPVYDPTTNMLYVTDTGPGIGGVAGGLVALSVQPNCGLTVAWSQAVGSAISDSPNSTPTLANGVVYVGVNDGSVSAYNAATGARLWNSGPTGFAVYAAPIVANGRVIAGSWNGAGSAAAGTITAWTPTTPLGLGVNPTSLSFTATAGGANPSAQTLSLTNGTSSPMTFSTTTGSNAGWLSVNPTSGGVPGTVSVQADVSGLPPGTYSATLTVTPSQGQAQSVPVTLTVNPAPTAPGSPTAVTATPENGSAVVSWTPPPDGGTPITYYTVTPFIGSTPQPSTQVANSPPATSATITGLTNGTAYSFTVTATNAVGTGPPSNPSAAVTPSAAAAPIPDVDVSANGSSATTTASFSTAQAGETLVAFVAQDGPAATGGQTSTVSGGGLAWKLAARANSQYGAAEVWSATAPSALSNVTVTATAAKAGYDQMLTVMSFENSGGVGAVSTAGAASGAPSATLITTNPNSLLYGVGNDWDNAIGRTPGANQTLTNQWIDSGNGDTFWVQDQNDPVAAAGSPTAISDTSPTTDRWNVAAVEVLGSAPVAPTVPSAPTGVVAVAGSQSAQVSWTQPADGGSPVQSYTVMPYLGSAAQTPTTVTGNPPATSVTVTGLTNGSAYTFTVVATNAIGNSPPSAPSSAVTPANATAPVPDVHVTVDATGITATTTAFSTSQASEVLVAFVSGDGPPGTTQTATVSGAGLTWSLVVRANGQYGTAEVWTAKATSLLSNVTVSSRESSTGFHQQLTVLSFSGSGGVGAANQANATTGAPSISITTTTDSSRVYAVGEDWDNAVARTVGTGQSMVSQWVDTAVGETFWVQQVTYPVASPALVMLNDTFPTTDRWNLAAVEVRGV